MRRQEEKPTVNYEELLEAQKDNSILIIDVREQSEIDKTGKLPGSIHIPSRNFLFYSQFFKGLLQRICK